MLKLVPSLSPILAANHELLDLYWRVGEYLSHKVSHDGWGQGTVKQLADLLLQDPTLRDFSASNLWRMRQFFDTYFPDEKLAPLVRELPWAHNLLILSKCKVSEERGFYLKLAIEQRWPKRELTRQIDGCLFERVVTSKPKLSAAVREIHAEAESIFKDSYLLDFLDLSPAT